MMVLLFLKFRFIFHIFYFFGSGFAEQQVITNFGQLFHVKVQPPPAQDKALRGQHRIGNSVFDFSLLCADGIPLLMEDHKPRPCQPRPWLPEHKCPTGFWCHEGQNESSFYCCPASRKVSNRCHLPPAVGYGKHRMRRFYFDWKTDACHELQYSGIGGNENSFMDYEKCEKTCRGAGEPPISLPSNMKILTKTEDEKKEKPAEKTSKKVVYPKEMSSGISLQPPTSPIGKVPKNKEESEEIFQAYFTTPTPTTTTEETVTDVLDPNPCILTPERGYAGSLAISMWYFDPSSQTCSPFLYLGKGGNSNRFESAEHCMGTCGIGKPTRKSCDLPPAIGNGPFNIPRYYFDKVTKKCERFFYSGRDGNDNRFFKKNKCERLCLKKKPKKKENIYEFTIATTPIPTSNARQMVAESTPMRIVQNLKPIVLHTESPEIPTESAFVFHPTTVPPIITQSPHITVEPWVEMVTENTEGAHEFEFEYSTGHPTLIYEPRGETLPTISPPIASTTTTPNIVDHVFSSLMNTQQKKLVELVNQPTESSTTEQPTSPKIQQVMSKYGTNERLPFGQVEQQPIVPFGTYGTGDGQPVENQYGMKVEPYNRVTDFMLPPPPPTPSNVYIPPPVPRVPLSIPMAPRPVNIEKTPSPNASEIPPSSVSNTAAPEFHFVFTTVSPPPSPVTVVPVTVPLVTVPSTTLPASLPATLPLVTVPPTPLVTVAPTPLVTVVPTPLATVPSLPPATVAPTPLATVPSLPPATVAPIETPLVTVPPTTVPRVTVTSTTPIPTLLPPNIVNITYLTSESPCERPLFGDATIMCESQLEICPRGTFCQIGHGQSICCPILELPPCDQSLEMGVGTSLIRRWYFDPATKLCQPFQFKGFKGNQNNFLNYEDCNRACGSTNICPIGVPKLSTHTHLLSCLSDDDCPLSHSCVQSVPSNLCCQKVVTTPNLVIDFVPPGAENQCEQAIDTGYGEFSEHRWAFSMGQCSSFLYRGQGGNMNNFLTRNDCLKNCQSATLSPSYNQCSMPASSGNGDQYLSRYFYSPEYHQCLHFIYSGDGGNSNNFQNLKDCLENCVAGVKFSSLAKNVQPPPTIIPPPPAPVPSDVFTFSYYPRNVCPQGDPLVTVDGAPIPCDPTKASKCPNDHVCTPNGQQAYCCPSPMNYCLQSRPALSVCDGPDFEPAREIRFTYDPLADRCIRFSFQNCRGAHFTPSSSLNNFVSNSQCNRLCCNQGYNLVYKRRLLLAMNDSPMES